MAKGGGNYVGSSSDERDHDAKRIRVVVIVTLSIVENGAMCNGGEPVRTQEK